MCNPPQPDVREQLSYSEQCHALRACKDPSILKSAHPKPCKEGQARAPGAWKIPFSDTYAKREDRPLFTAEGPDMPDAAAKAYNTIVTRMTCVVFTTFHIIAFMYAYDTMSWRNLAITTAVCYLQGMMGITFCYHRMLTHRSFKTYKWLEYFTAWLGTMAGQGGPIEWVSHHRYHHLHTDTPLDPHSPYEGFWWAHITWTFGVEAIMMDRSNTPDLNAQWYYQFLEILFFPQLVLLKPLLCYYLGGKALVMWGAVVPMIITWHFTFFVNSAAHIWGRRPYDTGDLSTNCWWVALLSFGEGWHNAHHAFPWSARHGLEWWEFDLTWYIIWMLEKLGLVWDVKVPSEKVKAAKAAKAMAKAA